MQGSLEERMLSSVSSLSGSVSLLLQGTSRDTSLGWLPPQLPSTVP